MFRKGRKSRRYSYLITVALVALATLLFYPGREYFAKGQWALLYLLLTVSIASIFGVRAALLASMLSFLVWNFFFLPPYNTFIIHDPKDWLALFVFLIVGLLIGIQTGRLRDREKEALAREEETALLNRFGAKLVLNVSEAEMGNMLISEVTDITKAECVALFLPDTSDALQEFASSSGASCQRLPRVKEIVEWVYKYSKAVGLPPRERTSGMSSDDWPPSVDSIETGIGVVSNDIFLPLRTATHRSGVLYIGPRSDRTRYTFYEARLLVALANQAAVFLERRHLHAIAIQADAAQEADRLKTTLLSAVSHELKTPLASMTAIVTNLLEGDLDWNAAGIRDELLAMQKDLERLNSNIGALLDLSRLEAFEWKPQMEWYDLGEILGSVVADLPQKERARISFMLPDDLPPIFVDFSQWSRMLHHLLENALAYSGDAAVRVGASALAKEIRIWVEDEGPGIAPEERHRVFDKFYRGKASASVPSGTGLGLAIADEIIRFHGGKIWIEDVKPHGARFVISLPRSSG